MKKLILGAFSLAILSSCQKSDQDSLSICKQCCQVISDSATGVVLEVKYGNPISSMYYCDGALRIYENSYFYRHDFRPITQELGTFHTESTSGSGHRDSTYVAFVNVSRTQKYQIICEN